MVRRLGAETSQVQNRSARNKIGQRMADRTRRWRGPGQGKHVTGAVGRNERTFEKREDEDEEEEEDVEDGAERPVTDELVRTGVGSKEERSGSSRTPAWTRGGTTALGRPCWRRDGRRCRRVRRREVWWPS